MGYREINESLLTGFFLLRITALTKFTMSWSYRCRARLESRDFQEGKSRARILPSYSFFPATAENDIRHNRIVVS